MRLNPIGAYAFRKTKVLDLGIEETPECTIHYSPDKLVAIAKNLDPVTERILTEHLERLSPTVYRLTRKSLFGKVTTPPRTGGPGESLSRSPARRATAQLGGISQRMPLHAPASEQTQDHHGHLLPLGRPRGAPPLRDRSRS